MNKWCRVTRKQPCKVCGRPDWCGYTEGAICCMRVRSEKQTRNGGWLHKTDDAVPFVPPKRAIEPPLNAEAMWMRWVDQTDHFHLDGFAMSLGVDTEQLRAIGCAWAASYKAWAFPMRDATGKVIGIRLRSLDGRKYAVTNSKQGLFYAQRPAEKTTYVAEGPTDTAAALTLGLSAIGRPSALGCEEMIVDYLRREKVSRVVILADNDEAGLRGTERLQRQLPMMSVVLILPVKDIREFVRLGGQAATLHSMIKDLVWERPKQRAA